MVTRSSVANVCPRGVVCWSRYYGLQATCKLKKVALILKKAVSKVVQGVLDFVRSKPNSTVVKLRYQTRLNQAYGHDPLRCQQCGAQMWLWQVWHPEYGVIYDEGEAIKAGKYEPPLDVELPAIIVNSEPVSQLSLFELQVPWTYA